MTQPSTGPTSTGPTSTPPSPDVGPGPMAGGRTSAGAGTDQGRPSLGELLSDITSDLSTLLRQEVQLAKAELQESAKRAGKGAGMLGGAGVAGHMVLVFLSVALWQLLAIWMASALAALLVAVVWGVVAAVLALRGRDEVKKVQGLPQTQDSVKKIPNALRGHEEENR